MNNTAKIQQLSDSTISLPLILPLTHEYASETPTHAFSTYRSFLKRLPQVRLLRYYELGETHSLPSSVEYSGLEPLTSTLPVSRSSQMS